MTVYIALLRGINVGGKNKIKMAELKSVLEAMGLERVQTYIQSGNVLLASDEEEEPLRMRLEQGIEGAFGFPVPVMLRTAEELERTAASCPFTEEEVKAAEASSEAESLYVAFLSAPPSEAGIARLEPYKQENEAYRIEGREVFLLFHNSVRSSKLAVHLSKLGVPSTVRNWKTVNKLAALAREMS